MKQEYVVDCLINESDMLDVKDVYARQNKLYLTLFDGSEFVVSVEEKESK